MVHREKRPASLALFCKVVDNYGDIGICWRLAQQLHGEHGLAVTLWVDDLHSFQRLLPSVDIDCAQQHRQGITIIHWSDQDGCFRPSAVADLVVEFFGCEIPPGYISAMAACEFPPVWLNLEGLSAEGWVEGCHSLPSPHPQLPLTKYFFFPGFTARTGGLLKEADVQQRRTRFQSEAEAASTFLTNLGVSPEEMHALKISLFCYPDAPVTDLFGAWQRGVEAITCLVPEGVAEAAVKAFLQQKPVAGAVACRGQLTVRVVPFLPQSDYDRLLWSCDVNFVRGEDSFVRAQWAGKPFIWQLYPQAENLHHVKLRAFLQRYAHDLDAVNQLSLQWNSVGLDGGDAASQWDRSWTCFMKDRHHIVATTTVWEAEMRRNGDLASNLLQFAVRLQAITDQNKV